MENTILKCNNLSKVYKFQTALNNVNLTLQKGKVIGLLGPNGSGKTTFIKLINGLLSPTAGEILINGLPPGIESRKSISYLPDKDYFDNSHTVESLLTLFLDFYDDFDVEKARKMLSDLKIDVKKKFKTFSKGNREKIQLILVMSRKAELYLLDEPIAGVDPVAREYILDTIIKNYDRRGTIIISTHLIADVEKVLDEAIFINMGDVVLHDSVENIKATYNTSVDEHFREVFR